MKYEILKHTDAVQLQRQVNERLAAGWQPLGGVAVTVYVTSPREGIVESWFEYAQAVVMP